VRDAFLASAAAAVLTFPLGIVTYRLAFIRRLSVDERELIHQARKTETYRSRVIDGLIGSLILVYLASETAADVPFPALVLTWAVTWPLTALSYAHYSLGLLRSDPAGWRDVISLKRRPNTLSVLVHLLLAVTPGALLLAMFRS
jgi:hypothetical protein